MIEHMQRPMAQVYLGNFTYRPRESQNQLVVYIPYLLVRPLETGLFDLVQMILCVRIKG